MFVVILFGAPWASVIESAVKLCYQSVGFEGVNFTADTITEAQGAPNKITTNISHSCIFITKVLLLIGCVHL